MSGTDLLGQLGGLDEQQLRRLLVEHLTKQKLGLYWEASAIEGDDYDALRLLRATHRGKIRVIYIDPPYNTGNKDWVYNDRWRHSQWRGVVLPIPEGAVKRVGRVGDCELLLCGEVNAATLKTLAAWPEQSGAARLAVYAPRPKTLSEKRAARGAEANCYGLMDALMAGQGGRYEPA